MDTDSIDTPIQTVDRRRFLIGAAAVAAAAVAWRPLAAGASGLVPANTLPAGLFSLGVGSGDPLPDRVVLWTRLAPDPLNGGGMPAGDVAVDWEMATDPSFDEIVAQGSAVAPEALAHSVHVDAGAGPDRPLDPNTWYSYRFRVGDQVSPIGQTRTAPATDADVPSMTFAFASCQSYAAGYYHAHRFLSQEPDLDLVLFLGDYIYEGGGQSTLLGRDVPGGEAATLVGYRNRYALYRSDVDLQAAHQRCPWVTVWDDHEVDNDYAGDVPQDDVSQGNETTEAFRQRRAAAYLAWWEHQAVRMPAPVSPDLEIYRSLTWGRLASFFAIDGRQYRDDQSQCPPVIAGQPLAERCDSALDDQRSMLGDQQEAWLFGGLRSSTATWNVIGNQTVFAATPLSLQGLPTGFNLDQWDGYPASRQRLLDVLAEPEVRNPLIVTGDIHAAGAGYLLRYYDDSDRRVGGTIVRRQAGGRIVGHEFVGTSISSTFPAALAGVFGSVASQIPWITYADATKRGYVTVRLEPTSAIGRWRQVADARAATTTVSTAHTWQVPAEEPTTPPRFVPAAFSDVAPTDRFATAVDWLKSAGITSGVSPTRFDVNGLVTRGQMALFLWRMMGEPTGAPGANFSDVPTGAGFAPAVDWLKQQRITTGIDGTTRFNPSGNVPRWQMALFLWRFAGQPTVSDPLPFTDVPADAGFAPAVRWLNKYKITTGTSPTRFSPDPPVRRFEMALFLYRLATTSQAWNVPLPPTAVVD
jgi:alkaline phosphatase D